MNWKGKKVLVTGAGGFIGSHLAEKLTALGAETRAMVHYRSNGSWGWLDRSDLSKDMEVIAGDIRDHNFVNQAVSGREIVFHLAALIAIPYSYQAPLSYVQTNVEGTVNVLQASREQGVERMVHTSTSEVYGSARYVPIDEAHPLQGQSPYSASKIGADKMAESFHLSFDLPVVTVRPFNTYGPRQSARAVIPTIITQALSGDTVKLGNIHPTRDFNFVHDTADGLIKVAESAGVEGQVINIGTGNEISIGDLLVSILKLMGKPDAPAVSDSARHRPEPSEVDRLCADNTKAKELTGWFPAHTLNEGLTETIRWVEENLEGFRAGVYAV